MEAARSREGYGWVVFAGILLIIAGLFDIVNGIRAIGAQDTAFDTIFWDNNLEAWGWFYLIVGVVLLVAGIAIFNRAPWAVLVGIAVAVVAAVVNMFWLFVYPIHSLIVIIVCLLIAYGLTVYGLRDDADESPVTNGVWPIDLASTGTPGRRLRFAPWRSRRSIPWLRAMDRTRIRRSVPPGTAWLGRATLAQVVETARSPSPCPLNLSCRPFRRDDSCVVWSDDARPCSSDVAILPIT